MGSSEWAIKGEWQKLAEVRSSQIHPNEDDDENEENIFARLYIYTFIRIHIQSDILQRLS